MTFPHRRPLRSDTRRYALFAILGLAALALATTACITRRGTYPIEVFPEQHYSQSFKSQEPPRLAPAPEAVPFEEIGESIVLDVPERRTREYNPAVAAELYRVNCSTCHGANGLGDGSIVPHLTAPDSFYAATAGGPYNTPPNLIQSRQNLNEQAVFAILTNGIVVMPRFGPLLSEEARWDLVRYIFDTQNGLGK